MKYKIGQAEFIEDENGYFNCQNDNICIVEVTENELKYMGAQLVEEEKPQEIELLPNFYNGWNEVNEIKDQHYKINEVIKAFNTHLSACGKEK